MLRRHGALTILLGLFFASWLGQFIAELIEVRNDAQTHGEPTHGPQFWSDFWPQFWSSTFENWQSEWLQLALQTLLLLYFSSRLNQYGEQQEQETMKDAVRSVLDERGL